jgi:hypothetical protein
MIAGYPVSWWVRPPVMPRWIGVVNVRLGFLGMMLLSPLIMTVVTYVIVAWIVKMTVLMLVMTFQVIVALATLLERLVTRNEEEEEPE